MRVPFAPYLLEQAAPAKIALSGLSGGLLRQPGCKLFTNCGRANGKRACKRDGWVSMFWQKTRCNGPTRSSTTLLCRIRCCISPAVNNEPHRTPQEEKAKKASRVTSKKFTTHESTWEKFVCSFPCTHQLTRRPQ